MITFEHLEFTPFDYPVPRWRTDLTYYHGVCHAFDLDLGLALLRNDVGVKNALFEYHLLILATTARPTELDCIPLSWFLRDVSYTPDALALVARALLHVIHGWVINPHYPASDAWIAHPHGDMAYNRRYPNLIRWGDTVFDGMGQQYYSHLQRRKSVFECDYTYDLTAADGLTVNTVQFYSDAHRRLPVAISAHGIIQHTAPQVYPIDKLIFTDNSTVEEIADMAQRVVDAPGNAWPKMGTATEQIRRSGIVVPNRIKAAVKRAIQSVPQMPQRFGQVTPLPVNIHHTERDYYEVAWREAGVRVPGLTLTPNSTHTHFTLDPVQNDSIPPSH